jgi:hypothetical protein
VGRVGGSDRKKSKKDQMMDSFYWLYLAVVLNSVYLLSKEYSFCFKMAALVATQK